MPVIVKALIDLLFVGLPFPKTRMIEPGRIRRPYASICAVLARGCVHPVGTRYSASCANIGRFLLPVVFVPAVSGVACIAGTNDLPLPRARSIAKGGLGLRSRPWLTDRRNFAIFPKRIEK